MAEYVDEGKIVNPSSSRVSKEAQKLTPSQENLPPKNLPPGNLPPKNLPPKNLPTRNLPPKYLP
jgi:hypothetical protein